MNSVQRSFLLEASYGIIIIMPVGREKVCRRGGKRSVCHGGIIGHDRKRADNEWCGTRYARLIWEFFAAMWR